MIQFLEFHPTPTEELQNQNTFRVCIDWNSDNVTFNYAKSVTFTREEAAIVLRDVLNIIDNK